MIDAGQDVLDAEREVGAGDLAAAPGAASTTNDGADGVSRVTCVAPSRRSRRTSTSVIVAVRPAMWIVPPVSPPAHSTVQRSVKALLTIDARGAVTFVQPAGNST